MQDWLAVTSTLAYFSMMVCIVGTMIVKFLSSLNDFQENLESKAKRSHLKGRLPSSLSVIITSFIRLLFTNTLKVELAIYCNDLNWQKETFLV